MPNHEEPMLKLYRPFFVLCLVTGLMASFQARADDPPSENGVARVSLTNGDVTTQRGDSGDWVAVAVNTPLVIGDVIATGPNSRAEVELDHAHILRLDEQTQVRIADLTDSQVQLQVAQGRIAYDVLRTSDTQNEIDTPNIAYHPVGNGVYYFHVDSDTQSEMLVRRGMATATSSQGSTDVKMNELIQVEGSGDALQFQTNPAPGPDDWDRWNVGRDNEILRAESWQHTNGYYVGANDLDHYGHWVPAPGYGMVWQPITEGPGWAPYREGRWVWEPHWGWTWVSSEPWGWAPYHYGRWMVVGGSWCWWPGPVQPTYRPVYAPAYVSFFSLQVGGLNITVGKESVGWIPIGPSDPCYPWWGRNVGRREVNVTNITYVTNVTNVTVIHPLAGERMPMRSNVQEMLRDDHIRRGITTVGGQDFVNGRMPQRPQPVDVATLREAHLIQGTVPEVPTRESLRPVNRPVNRVAIPKESFQNRHFVTTNRPPSGPRPFQERQAEIQRTLQQPPGAASQPRPGQGAQSHSFGQQPGSTATTQHTDWERPAAPQHEEGQPAQTTTGNWRGFGSNQPKPAPGVSAGYSSPSAPNREVQTPSQPHNAPYQEGTNPSYSQPKTPTTEHKNVNPPFTQPHPSANTNPPSQVRTYSPNTGNMHPQQQNNNWRKFNPPEQKGQPNKGKVEEKGRGHDKEKR
jgi:Family of unknown function (DUF6600)/FecR protein